MLGVVLPLLPLLLLLLLASTGNMPGYYYIPSNATSPTPSAAPCPADTWGRGLRKQRQCVSCFTGFTTGGVTGATSSSACCESQLAVCTLPWVLPRGGLLYSAVEGSMLLQYAQHKFCELQLACGGCLTEPS